MSVTKLSVSLDPNLEQEIRKAAGAGSVSSWLAAAARRLLRAEALAGAVADYEAQHGSFTDAELAKVRRKR